MDQERVDHLSRILSAPSFLSRRSALATLGTVVLGMLVGVDAQSTDAKPKSRHHTKSNDLVGSARLGAAKRKKHGRKHGQRHGQESQSGGATTPPPDGTGGGGCTSQSMSLTCAGKCGMIADNCARDVDCGQCQGPDGPDCVSPPQTTACTGLCGIITDSCRRLVDCCPCDGGCVSQDLATTCAGKCGLVKDNCSREVNCGNTCSGVETCGGGVSNNCGCTSQPKSVICSGRCGMETDNCGRQVDCGICPNGGCFIRGTRVRMADGSDKPIELVEPGDRVLGHGGRINRVRGVLYPLLGDRQLYALNGGTAFVTASHPFLTSDGWKAVDPEAARAEVPWLHIERLGLGDVLVSAGGTAAAADTKGNSETCRRNVQAQEHEISLQSLEGQSADRTTQLYNLDVDGDDTYVANRLVVHNKYR
jgi:hypothetical protein